MSKPGLKNGEREKRFYDAVQKTSGTRRATVKGDEAKPGSRRSSNSNKEVVAEKVRSSSWDFDEKFAPRAALREVNRLQDPLQASSRRCRPRASSVNTKRELKGGRVGSLLSNAERGVKSNLSRGASPMAHASHLTARSNKNSPQPLQIYRDEALRTALPAKTTSSCGLSKNTAAANSPLQAGLSRMRPGEKKVAKASPLSVEDRKIAKPSPATSTQTTLAKSTKIAKPSPFAGAESKQPEGLSSIQSSLHGRLSMLEVRVSKMAAELRETKELLDANNPICSKALLTNIQSKITNIERGMMGAPVSSIPYSGNIDSVSLRERVCSEKESFKRALQSLSDERRRKFRDVEHVAYQASSRRLSTDSPTLETKLKAHFEKHPPVSRMADSAVSYVSKLQGYDALDYVGVEIVGHELAAHAKAVFEGNDLQESQFQQNKLVKKIPSLHQKLVENQAAFHEKLKQNRELLQSKLADLGGRDRHDDGACDERTPVAVKFLTSLDDDRMDGDKALKQVKLYLEDCKASISSTGLSGGRMPVSSPVVSNHVRDCLQDMRSYYPVKEATLRSYGAETLSMPLSASSMGQGYKEHSSSNGSEFRKHRYSDATSDSPSSERSSPFYSQVRLSGREDSKNQRLNNSMDGEFAEIDHLRVSDGSHILRHPLKANGGKQATLVRPAEKVFISDTFSPNDLRCDESLLSNNDTDGDFSIPMGCYESPARTDEEERLTDTSGERLLQIGEKTAAAGWFVCEGEGILLAHEDGCCSYHDVANMEEKAEYRAPSSLASGVWGDCWMIRAAGTDGRSSMYIVAATAGGAVDSAFCSWDYYDRSIAAYHCQSPALPTSPGGLSVGSSVHEPVGASSPPDQHGVGANLGFKKWFDRSSTFNLSRLAGTTAAKKTFKRSISLDNAPMNRSTVAEVETKAMDPPFWWYRPCGALLGSAASGLRTVSLYDIRDGDLVMRWDTKKSVTAMKYSSPLQWRNKGKLVLAEEEYLSFWDVDSLEARRLHNVNLVGKQMRALHIYDVDAECSGGVRQRLSSSDHHSDGILCTNEAVNVLDFRIPTGIAMKLPTPGEEIHSVFANGDAVYAGATSVKTRLQSDGTRRVSSTQCRVNQWSIRRGKPMNVYTLPVSSSHSSHLSITQVWGSLDTVMAANGNGLFVFDVASRQSSGQETVTVRDVIGSDDLDSPRFDFGSSRVLLMSRGRPAMWCHWP